jgi:hypothetical protein
MSLPAAVSSAPIAVLVLAWDEATPAVRALVEATQASAPTVESILVMVPQANAPGHFSAEEHQALPVPPDYSATPVAAEPVTLQPLTSSEATISLTTPPLASTEAVKAPIAGPTSSAPLIPEPPEALAPAVAPDTFTLPETAPVPLGWAAVRVLHLGSYSVPQLAHRAGQPLPAPIWLGAEQLPAAPYLGATAIASPTAPVSQPTKLPSPSVSEPRHNLAAAHAVAFTPRPPLVATPPLASAPLYEPVEPALETDLPLPEEEEAEISASLSQDDLLSEEPLLLPTAAQAGWPEALAALRQPTALAEPTQAEPIPSPQPTPAFLQPNATHYTAPDLNFQIIQYARFAVPVALAEPEFVAIYAPAWPTWLAAQELRQRTGRPLVLHVATLAAADEPVSTATGWMAELQRQALQRADLILTETPALAERLRYELGLPAESVQAVAAADAVAIARALHTAQPRPAASQR